MRAGYLGAASCGHQQGLPRVPTLPPVVRAQMHLNLRATTHRWANRKLSPDSGGTLTHANDAITIGPTRMHPEPDSIISNRDRRAGCRLVHRHCQVLGLRMAFDVGD